MVTRIEEIIHNSGLNAKQFAEKLGVSASKITDWRNGKTKPTVSDIIRISQYFNVSCDYLLTGEDRNSNLTDDEQELISFYRKLDLFNKGKVIGMLTALVQSPSVFSAEEKVI